MKKNRNVGISVIIPAYNVEKYIGEALTSLEEQKFKNFEVIIVNDGSTDNTKNIAQKYCNKNNNFNLINKVKDGASLARKTGLDLARGEYIYFLDADDYIDKKTLGYLYKKAKENNLDCLLFNGQFKDEVFNDWTKKMNNKIIITSNLPTSIINGQQLLMLMINNREWRYAVWLYLVKKEIIISDNIDFFPKMIHEDAQYNFKMLHRCKRVQYFNKIFYKYRLRENSIMSSQQTSEDLNCYIKGYEIICNYIDEFLDKQRNQYRKFEIRMLDQIIETYYDELSKEERKKSKTEILNLIDSVKSKKYYYKIKYFIIMKFLRF